MLGFIKYCNAKFYSSFWWFKFIDLSYWLYSVKKESHEHYIGGHISCLLFPLASCWVIPWVEFGNEKVQLKGSFLYAITEWTEIQVD